MTESMENVYRTHHSSEGREGFSILEGERGALFKRIIGTGKKVLDFGCRDGTLTRHFTEGNDVTGADVDSHALERITTLLGNKTLQFDFNASQWPLKPHSFDVVVAAEVIEHLYFPGRVLERINRILKPGGMLIGSVPNAFSLKCRLQYLFADKRGTPLADPMHINQFGWGEFEALLKRNYINVRLIPIGKRWFGLRNLLPALFSFSMAFYAEKA